MGLREELIQQLETARENLLAQLKEIDRNRRIYPLWSVREILAHLSGWDDATIGFIHALVNDKVPSTPASRGIDVYNAETVSTREGLDYDHIYRECNETRRLLLDYFRAMPEEKMTTIYVLPWGGQGSLVDIVNILAPHEEEHTEDLKRIIESEKLKMF